VIDQVGLVRTSDGVLHVAWHKEGDLLHTAIGRSGKAGATSPIQSAWTGHMDAALTAVPGGIRVIWGAGEANRQGRVTLALKRGTARASASGFAPARLRVR
jgi:hypothetical protein